MDALSRLWFYKKSNEKTDEKFEDLFLYWVETDVLSLERMAEETMQEPVLSRINWRKGKNRWGNCFQAERPLQGCKTQTDGRKGIIYNSDMVVLPET